MTNKRTQKVGAGSDPKVVQSKARNASGAALACPCGRAEVYALCCGRFHAGAMASDAESLMRSRYTAYVLGLEDYLLATWHASTRPTALNLDTQPVAKWLGLEVKSWQAADAEDTAARVEFVARYRIGGRAVRLHEVSRFVCEDGRWYYVDGVVD